MISELTKTLAGGGGLKKVDPSILQKPSTPDSAKSTKPSWMGMALKKTGTSTTGGHGRSLSNGEKDIPIPIPQPPPPPPPVRKPEQTAVPVPVPVPAQVEKKEANTITKEKRIPLKPILKPTENTPSVEKKTVQETNTIQPVELPSFSKIQEEFSRSYKTVQLETAAKNKERSLWVLWIFRSLGFIMMVYSARECERLMRLCAVANGVMEMAS